MKMLALGGFLVVVLASLTGAFSARINDEFSVGTSLNKYLWSSPKEVEEEISKRDGEKRTTALWFGPRLGKRSQGLNSENLPNEILEILQKVQRSPELQNILAERLQAEASAPYLIYLPSAAKADLMMPRYLRDSPEASQNLNSRPYPPRFGRQSGGLPPYLPRLGRSLGDAE